MHTHISQPSIMFLLVVYKIPKSIFTQKSSLKNNCKENKEGELEDSLPDTLMYVFAT